MSGKSRFNPFVSNLLILAVSLFVFACGGGGGDDGGPETASVSINTSDGATAQTAGFQPQNSGGFANIASLKVEVYDGVPIIDADLHSVTGTLLSPFTTFLVPSGATWAGTVQGLPVGQTLTFVGRAFTTGNAAGPVEPDPATEIFTGASTHSLVAGANPITIVMEPHTITFDLPVITAIRTPAEIKIGDSAAIDADVSYNPNIALDYAFSGAGGSYTAGATGIVNTGVSGSVTLPPATFTAGFTAGQFGNNLNVTDPIAQVSTDQGFILTLVTGNGDGNIVTQFAPTVFSMSVNKPSSSPTLEFTAGVKDDVAPLNVTYQWGSTSVGPTFAPASGGVDNANPGVMVNYDPAAGGNVSLTVTDGDGLSTTVSFPLPVFPDDLIVKVFDFESGTAQGLGTTGKWHVSNRKAAGASARSMWFGDEASQNAGSAATTGEVTLGPVTLSGTTSILRFDYLHDLGASQCAAPDCPKLELDVGDGGNINFTRFELTPNTGFSAGSFEVSLITVPVVIRFIYTNPGTSGDIFDGAYLDNIRIDNQ